MNTRNDLYCIEGIALVATTSPLLDDGRLFTQRLRSFVSCENTHLVKKECVEETLVSLYPASKVPALIQSIHDAYKQLGSGPCKTCSSSVRCVFCPSQD